MLLLLFLFHFKCFCFKVSSALVEKWLPYYQTVSGRTFMSTLPKGTDRNYVNYINEYVYAIQVIIYFLSLVLTADFLLYSKVKLGQWLSQWMLVLVWWEKNLLEKVLYLQGIPWLCLLIKKMLMNLSTIIQQVQSKLKQWVKPNYLYMPSHVSTVFSFSKLYICAVSKCNFFCIISGLSWIQGRRN